MNKCSKTCFYLVVIVCFATVWLPSLPKASPDSEKTTENDSTDASALHGSFTGQLIFPIYVSDVERSAEFYRDVVGFEFLGYYDYENNTYVQVWEDSLPPVYAGFRAGDQTFGLHKPVNELQEVCIGCGRYYFRVHDLEEHYQRISSLGAEVSQIHSSALLTRFYMKDPDGTLIFLAVTNATAPLDPW